MGFVLRHPFNVGCCLLYSLLQGQGGGAKTNVEVVFFEFPQLKGDAKNKDRKTETSENPQGSVYFSVIVAVQAAYLSVENLFVIPLMRLEKENDPPPY